MPFVTSSFLLLVMASNLLAMASILRAVWSGVEVGGVLRMAGALRGVKQCVSSTPILVDHLSQTCRLKFTCKWTNDMMASGKRPVSDQNRRRSKESECFLVFTGMAMGPMALGDLVGQELFWKQRKALDVELNGLKEGHGTSDFERRRRFSTSKDTGASLSQVQDVWKRGRFERLVRMAGKKWLGKTFKILPGIKTWCSFAKGCSCPWNSAQQVPTHHLYVKELLSNGRGVRSIADGHGRTNHRFTGELAKKASRNCRS